MFLFTDLDRNNEHGPLPVSKQNYYAPSLWSRRGATLLYTHHLYSWQWRTFLPASQRQSSLAFNGALVPKLPVSGKSKLHGSTGGGYLNLYAFSGGSSSKSCILHTGSTMVAGSQVWNAIGLKPMVLDFLVLFVVYILHCIIIILLWIIRTEFNKCKIAVLLLF